MAENDFDLRIRRLTERHEAVTQSIELLTADVRDIQMLIRTLVAAVGQQHEQFVTLLEIVQSHERRINRLEGGQ